MNIDQREKYPAVYVKTTFTVNEQGVDYWTPVFYDQKCQLIKPFTLYALHCAQECLLKEKIRTVSISNAYDTKMYHIGGALKSLLEFLAIERIAFECFDDNAMEEFRLWDLNRILDKNGKNTEEVSNRTVNIKLRIIYSFYLWAQDDAKIIEDHISWARPCKIRSKLQEYKDHPERFRKLALKKKQIYPLCYSEISRHVMQRQHFASSDEIDRLKVWWRQNSMPLVAERNVMIVECIESHGWRRGSTASLNVLDFINETYPSNYIGNIDVQPVNQKYNQGHVTEVKANFLIRVRYYIDNVRAEMLKDGAVSCDALFLSKKTGGRLDQDTITRIISDGFRAIGLKYKRMGPHSIRRKKGTDVASDIITGRTRDGSSVNPEDITLEIASNLQQDSTSATSFYVKGMQEYRANQPEAKLREVVVEKDTQISRLEIEKARLLARDRQHELEKARLVERIIKLEKQNKH